MNRVLLVTGARSLADDPAAESPDAAARELAPLVACVDALPRVPR